MRHLKTAGPLPILWDRWQLANPFSPRLRLDALLEAWTGRAELMLDLKGRNLRLSELVLEAVRPLVGVRPLAVCSRSWPLLEPFHGLDRVRVVYSAGKRRELRRLLRLPGPLDGVSIHADLLDAAVVRELRARARVVMSWPVNTAERARRLAALGVDGLISDESELVQAVLS